MCIVTVFYLQVIDVHVTFIIYKSSTGSCSLIMVSPVQMLLIAISSSVRESKSLVRESAKYIMPSCMIFLPLMYSAPGLFDTAI